jgi:hypothetical protein
MSRSTNRRATTRTTRLDLRVCGRQQGHQHQKRDVEADCPCGHPDGSNAKKLEDDGHDRAVDDQHRAVTVGIQASKDPGEKIGDRRRPSADAQEPRQAPPTRMHHGSHADRQQHEPEPGELGSSRGQLDRCNRDADEHQAEQRDQRLQAFHEDRGQGQRQPGARSPEPVDAHDIDPARHER